MSEFFHTERRVEFAETDAAGIAHFSSFFQYMEQAEHELLRHVGLSVFQRDEEGLLSWPRVHAHCDYRGAVQFEQVLAIRVAIKRLGRRSVTYQFHFESDAALSAEAAGAAGAAGTAAEIAYGELASVCCRIEPGQPLRSIDIPDGIRAKLRPFVNE